jgi:hypothetical protein
MAVSLLGVAGCSDLPSEPQVAHGGSVRDTDPALSVYIAGTSEITYPTWYLYAAYPSGGNGTYSYQWQSRIANGSVWSNVGTNSSTYDRYVGANSLSFVLRVIVTSNGVSVVSPEFAVQNCGSSGCSDGV